MKAFASPIIAASWFFAMAASPSLAAEEPVHDHAAASSEEVSCIPVEQRAQKKLGCYVLAREALGELPNGPGRKRDRPRRTADDAGGYRRG